jgi:hypothetical protein
MPSFSRKKKAKAEALFRRFLDPQLGEADPESLRACPQEVNWSNILLFPEKEAKSVVLLRRKFLDPKLGEADQGGLV